MWPPVALVTLYYSVPALSALDRSVAWVVLGGAIVSCVSVAIRHRRPRLGAALSVAALAVSPSALGGAVGIVASLARRLQGRRAAWTLLAVVLTAVLAKALQLAFPIGGNGWSPVSTVEFTISTALLGFALLVGLLLRSTARSVAAAQAAEEARAAEVRLEERARIAREMHDVVAHRISLVVMNAGALGYREDLPEDVQEAVGIVHANARAALTELRAVLADLRRSEGPSTLRTPEAPQPTLEHLPVLVAEAREVTDVALTLDLDPAAVPTPTGRQLYRIVQEGLTNARKHAPGQSVNVTITRSGGEIVTTIGNHMVGVESPWDTRSGYGLVGVQERARLLGGRADVETIEGRFVLRVRVPEKLPS